MQAAEAFWKGKVEAFEFAVDKLAPSTLDVRPYMDAARIKDGGGRDGVAWRADILKKADKVIPYFSLWKASMETEIVATEAANRAIESLTKLDTAAKKFREVVRNDLTSMKATSDRVQTEVESMSARYKQAADMLTTPEFEKALLNAERMATALKAISELSETKLSVAVFGGGK